MNITAQTSWLGWQDCVLHAVRGALLLHDVVHPRGRRPRLPEIPVVPVHVQLLPDLHDLLPRALLFPDNVPGRKPERPRLGHRLHCGCWCLQFHPQSWSVVLRAVSQQPGRGAEVPLLAARQEWGWRCSARCSAQESRGRWWALTTATRRMAAPSGTGPCPTAAPPASPARWRSRAYVSASLVLGSIYCLSCLILVFGVREQPGPLSPLGKAGLPFTSCLRTIVGHKPYTHLLCGFLFASLAFQVMQGIFAFFCTHAAGLAGKFQHLVLIMLVTASLSIPFWQWFLGRFGKKTAVTLGLALIIPALVAITLVSHNFPAFVLLMVVAGCSSAVLYLLPWSMLPDAVDDFMLRNPNCLNLEALFYSFYVFFNKFAGGLAVGISTLGLHFAGYRARDCTYNPSVTLALKLLMTPVPIILLLIAITIFCLHPINEERRKQMRMELEAMGRQARRGSSDHHQG
ncbi:sodium-dependent lysophosphatidylcholine symporter 1-like isoform X8 [Cygnus olor]|uniref:sodium-dependent lysophosphatidylcholine symporter 1-like isoform X8 n=1 Tax=Cygnus olor TaxID=8869 RepID=UPI001ADE982A|nr:sodium-dependent lysophosphatidylcholine symporter 1-like isoform X8 [Cygnus olor]